MNEEFNPCPACGSKNLNMVAVRNYTNFWIVCNDCRHLSSVAVTRNAAIKAWNEQDAQSTIELLKMKLKSQRAQEKQHKQYKDDLEKLQVENIRLRTQQSREKEINSLIVRLEILTADLRRSQEYTLQDFCDSHSCNKSCEGDLAAKTCEYDAIEAFA